MYIPKIQVSSEFEHQKRNLNEWTNEPALILVTLLVDVFGIALMMFFSALLCKSDVLFRAVH